MSGGEATAVGGGATLDVSVVIPAHDRAEMVERALASVRAQRPRPPGEVIVVDDGSTDETAARAEHGGARVIRHSSNRGAAAARNTGIWKARSTWVALLDSDDEWLSSHLDHLWKARADHVLVADSALFVEPARRRWDGAIGPPVVLSSPAQLLFPANIVATSACMFRRDAAQRANGYREDRIWAEDLEFLVRLLEQGTGVVTSELGALYHGHAQQASVDLAAMRAGHRAIITDHEDQPWYSPALLRSWDARCTLDDALAARRRGSWGEVARGLLQLAADPRRVQAAISLLRWRRALARQLQDSRAL